MAQSEDAWTLGSEAYLSGLHGDFRKADAAIAPLRAQAHEDDIARAFLPALSAQRWHAEPERGVLPREAELRALVGATPPARSAAALACAQLERAALLAFDGAALKHLLQTHASLVAGGGETAEVLLWLDAGRIWSQLAEARLDSAYERAVSLGQHALDLGLGALAVEAMTLRAAIKSNLSELDEAAADARRASRMARTEELPQSQYLANVVLARVRRLTGRPHLATRILSGLLDVASSPWRAWLLWELLLAGGLAAAERVTLGTEPVPARTAASALREMMTGALAGDRARFDDAVAGARASLEGYGPHAFDLEVAIAAIDAEVPSEAAPEPLRDWCAGRHDTPPPALRGIAAHTGRVPPEQATAAYAVARPGRPGRRVVGLGAALVSADLRLDPMRGRPGRSESLVAQLVYAGDEGIARDVLFSRIYGFAFESAVHKNTFDVLLHRARAALGDVATIRLEEEVLRLDLAGSLVVPDPRCEQPIEDLLLRILARRETTSAREVSELLGVPLRTAQRALGQLVEEGALIVEKQGRRHAYRVEDTTFSQPTTRHYVREDIDS